MRDVAAYVARNPGRAMWYAACFVGPNGSAKFGYRAVHRAIKAGLVRTVHGPRNAVLLYPAKEG